MKCDAWLALGLCFVLSISSWAQGKQEDPGPTAAELTALDARFKAVKGGLGAWEADAAKRIEKAQGKERDKLQVDLRRNRLSFLRFVMMLETDLRLLSSPLDQVDIEREVPELGLQEKRRVAGYRQKVRDEECKRIREALKGKRGLWSEERAAKDILDEERGLDSLFDRKCNKLRRDLARAQRNLDRERKSARGKKSEILKLEAEIERWDATLAEIHEFIYGYRSGIGFESEAGEGGGPAGELLGKLVTERDRLLTLLRKESELGGEEAKRGGLIGGSYVISANLGVLLDVSGSMAPHIEPLKEEIAKTFQGPRYGEVKGCRLSTNNFWQIGMGKSTGGADSMTVIDELIVIHQVDALFWFCDLLDGRDFRSIRHLRTLVKRGGVSFHVKSMGKRPDRLLKPLINEFEN